MDFKFPIKFKLDSKKLKQGFYTSEYFLKAKNIVKKYKKDNTCVMQFTFFNPEPKMVCGIYESVQLLKACLTKKELKQIEIYGHKDGDIVQPFTPVLLIKGPYHIFSIYENIIDGILTRRSSVATNCWNLLKIIDASNVLYMADRTNDYFAQAYDGYAAYVGGMRNFVTDASVAFIKNDKLITVKGTMPHALIQQFNGDIVQASKSFVSLYGIDNLSVLIDYNNDIEKDIIKISQEFKNVKSIRVDTSINLVDFGLQRKFKNWKNKPKLYGVNHELIKLARKTLDNHGLKNTKIIISSGLSAKRIQEFLKLKTPFDICGVGSNLLTPSIHFTADLVMLNNQHQAKYGRKLFIDLKNLKTLTKY